MVYVPYCTGDVHTGANVVTYSGGGTDPDLEFHHDGHAVVQKAVSWIDENFTHIPKMLATGCSAGGVGSLVNYQFLRRGVSAIEKGYLLDDSGPVFPSTGLSPLSTDETICPAPLHWFTLQSPTSWPTTIVPAAVNEEPQTLFVHVLVRHSVSTPGHVDAARHSTQTPAPPPPGTLQCPLAQSAPLKHWLVLLHLYAQAPPQSTSVSSPFWMPSVHDGGTHNFAPPQTLLKQSKPTLHVFRSAHLAAHAPPQSTSVSVPFSVESLQTGT
jgi:hypothetical protein